MSRWVTYYHDIIRDSVYELTVHNNKEDALKYFNANCKNHFQTNTNLKANKLPAYYGFALRQYCGVSAMTFKKTFGISVDEALKIAESEDKE